MLFLILLVISISLYSVFSKISLSINISGNPVPHLIALPIINLEETDWTLSTSPNTALLTNISTVLSNDAFDNGSVSIRPNP